MGKYYYFKDGVTYTVIHKEKKVETLIALTDTLEKAYFITKACNQFNLEEFEQRQNKLQTT